MPMVIFMFPTVDPVRQVYWAVRESDQLRLLIRLDHQSRLLADHLESRGGVWCPLRARISVVETGLG